MKNNQSIRNIFINFFQNKNHNYIKPSSLLLKDSPSLFFTNSGMNQFKKYFTLEDKAPYKRAVSIQNCIRAGGKHNDLDNVGFTTRHNTFFEMMGNFSFQDYGNKEAILFAIEFLTKELNISEKKLFFTVHLNDLNSYNFLKSVTNQPVLQLNTDDNFWSMGDLGPCGYCCEIYYYIGIENNPTLEDFKQSFNEKNPKFLEIWNLVFMEFNKTPQETIKLDKISIDTGMGLERLLSIIEGTYNNYKTSIIIPIIEKVQELLDINNQQISYVVADHIKTSVFLINEGLKIGNEGPSYVLRKIIRRALTYLNLKKPGFYKLVSSVVELYKDYYNFIDIKIIEEQIYKEEILFLNTINNGFHKLEEYLSENNINEKKIFKLYETYGLPLDFSTNYLQQKGINLNNNLIDDYMIEHKKASGQMINYDFNIPTISSCYEKTFNISKVLIIFKNGENIKEIDKSTQNNKDEEFLILTEESCFYPRGGGQEGDKGIISNKNCEIEVFNTTKKNKSIIHHCKLISGFVKIDDFVNLKIDEEWRIGASVHHTATHIFHAILQKLYGNEVDQKGSLITKDKFRFDFNLDKGLSMEERYKIENIFQEIINKKIPIDVKYLSFEEAQKQEAIMLQNTEYEDIVRVINIPETSLALCGGTHLDRTDRIKSFKIISEKGHGKGIRRVECVCEF